MKEAAFLVNERNVVKRQSRELSFEKIFKPIFWSLVFSLAIIFFFTTAFKYFFVNQTSYGPFWQNRFWLFIHVTGGSIALLSGPIQFLPFIRRKYINFHRWTGRIYLLGILLGALSAFNLSVNSVVGWMFGTALFVLAIVWVTTTTMAVICIRRREIEAHKVWMTRSYIVTFAFLIFRVLMSSPLLAGVELHYRFAALIWFSWIPTLLIYEVGRQIKLLAGKRSVLNAPGYRKINGF